MPQVVCAAEPLVLNAAQASVSLRFRSKISTERAANGLPRLMQQWNLALRALPNVGPMQDRTRSAKHSDSQNGADSAVAPSACTRFVRVNGTVRNDNATLTEGRETIVARIS